MREAATSDWASGPYLALHFIPAPSVRSQPQLYPLVSLLTNWKVDPGAGMSAGPPGPWKRSRVARSTGSTHSSRICAAAASGGTVASSLRGSLAQPATKAMATRTASGRVQRDAFIEASGMVCAPSFVHRLLRSEEHTSELQSQSNLVCR